MASSKSAGGAGSARRRFRLRGSGTGAVTSASTSTSAGTDGQTGARAIADTNREAGSQTHGVPVCPLDDADGDSGNMRQSGIR